MGKLEEIPLEDMEGAGIDFLNNRIITKDGKIYENVQVNLDDVRRWLEEEYPDELAAYLKLIKRKMH